MLNKLSPAWKDSLTTNPFTEVRVYIGPRGKEYAPVTGTPSYTRVTNQNLSGEWYLSGSTLSYLVTLTSPMTMHWRGRVGSGIGFQESFAAAGNSLSVTTNETSITATYISNTITGTIVNQWNDYTVTFNGASSKIYVNGREVASGNLGTIGMNAQVMTVSGDINYLRIIPNYAATEDDAQTQFRTVYHEEIFFPYNKAAVGYARCNINRQPAVTGYSIERQTGYLAATASVSLINVDGRFSSDQYATYTPEAGSYNGTSSQRYLTRKMPMWIELYSGTVGVLTGAFFYPSTTLYPSESLYPQGYIGDTGIDTYPECLFFGFIPAGSFLRSTQWGGAGSLSISAIDGIQEMARRVVRKARYFENYYLSRETDNNDSLFHAIAKLATRREVYNYLADSSFEGTTANSWDGGLTSNTTRPFHSTKSLPLTGTSSASQAVYNEYTKGERVTFYGYFYCTSAVNLTLSATERVSTVSGSSTSATFAHSGKGWDYFSITHELANSNSDNVLYAISTTGLSATIYADALMVTYGDPVGWYVDNDNEGTSGDSTVDDSKLGTYDWIGIDAENVAYIHPWATIKAGAKVYDELKKLADACIVKYMLLTEEGVLKMQSNFNDTGYTVVGPITKIQSLGSGHWQQLANKMKAQGCKITKRDYLETPWEAKASNLEKDEGLSGSTWKRTLPAGSTLPASNESPDGYEARYGDTSKGPGEI